MRRNNLGPKRGNETGNKSDSEHWYLICYDIREPRRLQKLHSYLQRCAFALQESVFIFPGTAAQWQQLQQQIRKKIKTNVDDVKVYQLPAGFTLDFYGQLPWPDGVWFSGYPPTQLHPLPEKPTQHQEKIE